MNIDPLADINQESWNPYHFNFDNPLRFIDPTGLYSTEKWKEDNGVTDNDLITVYDANNSNDENEGDANEYSETNNSPAIPAVSLKSENSAVKNKAQDLDPYDFHFFTNETDAYTTMLTIAENGFNNYDYIEIAAYIAVNKQGQKGILILPWFANEKYKSKTYNSNLDVNSNTFSTDKNVYTVSGYIHTHDFDATPSEADMVWARYVQFQTYIFTGLKYLVVDPRVSKDQQAEPAFIYPILQGDKSLLDQ